MFLQTYLLALAGAVSALAMTHCPVADVSAIAHSGKPVGKEVEHDDSECGGNAPSRPCAYLIFRSVTLYVTGRKSDTAVLYLTDVFGIQLDENKLYEHPPLSHH